MRDFPENKTETNYADHKELNLLSNDILDHAGFPQNVQTEILKFEPIPSALFIRMGAEAFDCTSQFSRADSQSSTVMCQSRSQVGALEYLQAKCLASLLTRMSFLDHSWGFP